jgi:peptide/nickel transport system permease protein
MLPVLLLVSVVIFGLLLLLPGDTATVLLGEQATPELLTQVRTELGLDRPVPERYVLWLGRALRGDFGRSTRTQQPVAEAVLQRVPPTLQITAVALVFAIALGIPLGMLSALRRGKLLDLVTTAFVLSGTAMPSFWLGILLVLLFSLQLKLLPASGWSALGDNPLASLQHTVLPSLTLGLLMASAVARQSRGCLLEVLIQDYIRTARAKGLRDGAVVVGHALRNALLPVVTIIGLQIGRLIGGAVVVETIFAVPGMGRLMIDSIFTRDFPVVQACALFIAIGVLAISLLTDVAYAYLDPRIRYR